MGLKPIIITCRELEVLLRLAKSNKEIAKDLGISVGAVNTYYYRLSAKLNAATRTEIVIKALQKRVVTAKEFIT